MTTMQIEVIGGMMTAEEQQERVTGYLNTKDRFNNAKQAEVADRVPHGYDTDYYSHDVSGLLD